MFAIPELRGLRRNGECKASLGYIASSRAAIDLVWMGCRFGDRQPISSLSSLGVLVDNIGLFFQVTCTTSLWDLWARGTASQVEYTQRRV